jgi:hypothetical protein
MPAKRWRCAVRGDSSTMSRVAWIWSASAACSRSSWPSTGAGVSRTSPDSSRGVNCRASVRISAASDSSTSATACTR